MITVDVFSSASFAHPLHIEIQTLSTDKPSQSISETSILVNPKDVYVIHYAYNKESAMAYLLGSS